MKRLDGKVAVVTGGANGMGLACCERFAEEGARIVIGDVIEEAGAAAVSGVRAAGGEAVFVPFDAASRDDTEALMQTALDRFGGLDVLVAAAGISHGGYRSGDPESLPAALPEPGATPPPGAAIIDCSLEDWNKVLAVNLNGTLFAIQAAARRMRELTRPGSIITFSAIGAKIPGLSSASYAVSKAGIWMLTKEAAVALAPLGIRVNAIGPGTIETNMTLVLKELPQIMEALMDRTLMKRPGTPREVANAALFLASDEASYFTGEMLHPDGGVYTE
jgi:NAD(P)-dependent dehydrogenase (short-subunit alcohol dehydrogenase family)